MDIKSGRILIVDDNKDVLIAANMLLKQYFSEVITSDNPFEIEKIISTNSIDVVLLDMNFTKDSISGSEGFYWLNKILEIDQAVSIVLMTAYYDIPLSVKAIKHGACDFIAKPWENDLLVKVVISALQQSNSKKKLGELQRKNKGYCSALGHPKTQPMIGDSDLIQSVFETLQKAAKTDASVLLLGESGTGKSFAAKFVHEQSLRREQMFLSVDIGSLQDSLFESELFGHKKGAFTDAKGDRAGRFELAHNGTLFLDEIANVPLSLQAKLLRVIQENEVTPIGGNKAVATDVRLICATNENLTQAVFNNKFRQDLLYRINTIEITIPPLRARKSDIPLLAKHYLTVFCQKYNRDLTLNKPQLKQLTSYSWPGNIRELSQVLERAVILHDKGDIDFSPFFNLVPQSSKAMNASSFNLEIIEKETIAQALSYYKGNLTETAKAVGLTRGALYRRLDKYEL